MVLLLVAERQKRLALSAKLGNLTLTHPNHKSWKPLPPQGLLLLQLHPRQPKHLPIPGTISHLHQLNGHRIKGSETDRIVMVCIADLAAARRNSAYGNLGTLLVKPCGDGLVDHIAGVDGAAGFLLPIHIGT